MHHEVGDPRPPCSPDLRRAGSAAGLGSSVSLPGYFLSFFSSVFSKARKKFVFLPVSGKEAVTRDLDA